METPDLEAVTNLICKHIHVADTDWQSAEVLADGIEELGDSMRAAAWREHAEWLRAHPGKNRGAEEFWID